MNILFEDNFDTGDFSRWHVSPSGLVQYKVQSQIVHSGTRAAKLTIQPLWLWGIPLGATPGVRLAYHTYLPDSAYYSAWYYLPSHVRTSWLNLMQWKQRQVAGGPTYVTAFVRLQGDASVMQLSLSYKIGASGENDPAGHELAGNVMPVPVGEWFEIRTYYRWSKSATGRMAAWLNDVLMWDVNSVQTQYAWPDVAAGRQWAVNNYAADVNPNPCALYVDDCKVWTQ